VEIKKTVYKGIWLSFAITVLVGVVLLVPKSAWAMPYFEDATVTNDEISLRIRPSDDAGVITMLTKDTRLGVFCEEIDGWYRVIYGNYRGYVATDDVFLPSTDSLSGNVKTDGLSVHMNPASGGKSVGTLDAGYPLKITNIVGSWYKIEATDSEGDAVEGYVPQENVLQAASSEKATMVLQEGMEGTAVAKLQKALAARGFYGFSTSGVFTSNTTRSLKKFQKHADLEQTGIADDETLKILYSNADIHSGAQDLGVNGSVQMASWWDVVQYEFAKGAVATIRDLGTGKTFKVQRYSGHNHADCEPLTAEDTAIMRACYGGSWSWARRPIWVTVGGTTYAASMNGNPHAAHEARISDNGFNGHFCVHFYNSYGHGSNSEDTDHAQAVKDAYYASIY